MPVLSIVRMCYCFSRAVDFLDFDATNHSSIEIGVLQTEDRFSKPNPFVRSIREHNSRGTDPNPSILRFQLVSGQQAVGVPARRRSAQRRRRPSFGMPRDPPERNTLEEGLTVQRVIEAIDRSSETGRTARPDRTVHPAAMSVYTPCFFVSTPYRWTHTECKHPK